MADIKYKLDWFSGTKKPSEQAVEDTSRKGIASRPGADTPTQEDYYTKMYRLMSSYFDSDEEASKVLSSKKPNSDAIKSMTMQEYAEAVKESAGFVSKAREMAGITKSLTEGGGEIGRKPLPEGTTLRPVARPPMTTLRDVTDTDEGMLDDEQPLRELSNAVSSKLIKATEIETPVKEETDEDVDALVELVTDRRSAGKDTEESTPVTVEARSSKGLMSKPSKATREAVSEAKTIVKDTIGLPGDVWDAYRQEISAIESGGLENPYAAKGGANNHYDGMYQLGKVAKTDASSLLGMTLGHDAAAREAYRNDPALQEKAFAAFTAKNHSYLTKKSQKYRELPLNEKLAVLGYAHNQGWSGAKKWLETGVEGKDAFGTKGSKYYNAITKRLGE